MEAAQTSWELAEARPRAFSLPAPAPKDREYKSFNRLGDLPQGGSSKAQTHAMYHQINNVKRQHKLAKQHTRGSISKRRDSVALSLKADLLTLAENSSLDNLRGSFLHRRSSCPARPSTRSRPSFDFKPGKADLEVLFVCKSYEANLGVFG